MKTLVERLEAVAKDLTDLLKISGEEVTAAIILGTGLGEAFPIEDAFRSGDFSKMFRIWMEALIKILI